jgi:RNA-binding protein
MINDRQRAYLRKLAQTLTTKYQVGKEAVHPELIKLLDLALTKHELIKLHVLKSTLEKANSIIPELAKTLNADVVQTIGHRVVLFRSNPDQPRIQLPK